MLIIDIEQRVQLSKIKGKNARNKVHNVLYSSINWLNFDELITKSKKIIEI